jgi:hypothetical protein
VEERVLEDADAVAELLVEEGFAGGMVHVLDDVLAVVRRRQRLHLGWVPGSGG